MKKVSTYPGFKYTSNQLSKFIRAGELFTIKLINNEIIHHETEEPLLFRQWLLDNCIEDIVKDAKSTN
jgi:hypothetical protein